ncbi:MAG TPA: ABC transporter permease [Chitinophagaceae bacterium]|nr:ABC transporter permease [Chitinophagaceae bacterium]
MFRNYLKVALRNLWKNKGYAAINIGGLTIGLTCFLLLLLYLNYEFSYDRWNPQLKQVFRISQIRAGGDYLVVTPEPLGSLLQRNSPVIHHVTDVGYWGQKTLFNIGNQGFYVDDVASADSAFFTVFPYKLLEGNPRTVLEKPGSLVLTPEVSRTLFGDEDPVGKTLKIYNSFPVTVTGIMATPKGPSAMPIKAVWVDPFLKLNNHWGAYVYKTFVLTMGPVSSNKLQAGLNKIYYDLHLKEGNKTLAQFRSEGNQDALVADAMPDLHNFSKHQKSNINTVWILFLLAVLLLVSGMVNFTNLSVACNMSRAREVGVRKVLGSSRSRLMGLFFIETVVQCIVALFLSLILTELLLPLFNSAYGLHLSLWKDYHHFNIFAQIGISLAGVVILSGIYPAVYLFHFTPAVSLKGNFSAGRKGKFFRNVLIVVQFAVSTLFIIGILIIYSQMRYMKTRDLGLQTSQLLTIQTIQDTRDKKFSLVKNMLLSIPGVESVAKTTMVPGNTEPLDTTTNQYLHAGNAYRLSAVKVSADYFNTIGVKILSGRGFSASRPVDTINSAIINESAVRKLGLENPVGAQVFPELCQARPYRVIGVVHDFHVAGFAVPVLPTIYSIANYCPWQSGGRIIVRLDPRHISATLAGIKSAWKRIEPGHPIRYSFVDDDFAHLLLKYNRLEQLIFSFSVIAISIALMGLLAIVAFTAKQRTKEIGIRKVLGASVTDILQMLTKNFIWLVLIANIIAWPVVWLLATRWLNGFAYRIDMPVGPFVIAWVLSIVLTVVVVSLQSWKAVRASPVNALKYE